jgi:hypothetical protein
VSTIACLLSLYIGFELAAVCITAIYCHDAA